MDLHPEDLIERDADGMLARSDRERLEAHLSHCASCRMERRARIDFRRVAERVEVGHEAYEADRVELDVRALVANVLRPERVRARETARARFGRLRLGRLRVALVAAALLTLTGLAAAAAVRWPVVRGLWNPPTAAPVVPPAAAPPLSPHGLAGLSAAPSPQASLEEPAAAIETATSAPAEAPLAGEARGNGVTPASDARMATTPEGHGTSATSPPVGPVDDAQGLFSKANTARRRGDRADATASYQRLVARYPASPEARESYVAVGRMLLDTGDAAQALRNFEAYARLGGPLAEEALLGEALALQALGRAERERRAWTALVDLYPDSVHVERARARLADLGR